MSYRNCFDKPISTQSIKADKQESENNKSSDKKKYVKNNNSSKHQRKESETTVDVIDESQYTVNVLCPRGYKNISHTERHTFHDCIHEYNKLLNYYKPIHEHIRSCLKEQKFNNFEDFRIDYNNEDGKFYPSVELLKFLHIYTKIELYIASAETMQFYKDFDKDADPKDLVVEKTIIDKKKPMTLNTKPIIIGKSYAKFAMQIIAIPVIEKKNMDFDYFIAVSPFTKQKVNEEKLTQYNNKNKTKLIPQSFN